MSTVVVQSGDRNPGCLIQLLWFALVGWWLGQIWIAVAWFLTLTVIGIPIAVAMLNKIPQIIALRGQSESVHVRTEGHTTVVSTGGAVPQRFILTRAVYFVLIGWWFSAIWMEVAYVLCATIIGLPLGFWMFDRVPAVVSLHR